VTLTLTGPDRLSMTWEPAGVRDKLGTAVLTRSRPARAFRTTGVSPVYGPGWLFRAQPAGHDRPAIS
jgi:hypothetical protein